LRKWQLLGTSLLAVAALAGGCGGSSGSSGSNAGTKAAAAAAAAANQSALRASIGVASPAVLSNGAILPQYTCQGANQSIPLKWAGITSAAQEIILLVRSFVTLAHPMVNWAVTGISPSVQQIAAGQLPPGAIVGRNSFGHDGYDLCLPKGTSHMLVTIGVEALPHKLSVKPGFDPEAMLNQARSPGVAWGSILGFLGHPATTTERVGATAATGR
jgi:phosphatidylethanolamine-binding protein (PEBP) family uncharacterized protein